MDLDELARETRDQVDALMLHYTTVNLYIAGLSILCFVLPVFSILGLGWTGVNVVRLFRVYFSFNQLWLKTPAQLRSALKQPLLVLSVELFLQLYFAAAFTIFLIKEVLP